MQFLHGLLEFIFIQQKKFTLKIRKKKSLMGMKFYKYAPSSLFM